MKRFARQPIPVLRYVTAFCAALVILATQSSFAFADPDNPEIIPGIETELFFRSIYKGLRKHKAIAIGPLSHWSAAFGHGSTKEAQKAALRSCKRNLEATTEAWLQRADCKPFAVNDKIIWPEPLVGISLDEDLPLPDNPLLKAQVYWPKTKPKAILLALHGCNRPSSVLSPWMKGWIDFFVAREIGVIDPSSFDDPRPPGRCGLPNLDNHKDYIIIDKLRIGQTKRTLRQLRKAHPDLPIYLWGHSGGGFVVQAIDLDVAGIIVTGHVCGLGDPRLNLVRRSTSLLYIFGENDKSLASIGKPVTPKAVRARCGKSYETAKRRWVVVKGADHFVAISNSEVAAAVDKLLGR